MGSGDTYPALNPPVKAPCSRRLPCSSLTSCMCIGTYEPSSLVSPSWGGRGVPSRTKGDSWALRSASKTCRERLPDIGVGSLAFEDAAFPRNPLANRRATYLQGAQAMRQDAVNPPYRGGGGRLPLRVLVGVSTFGASLELDFSGPLVNLIDKISLVVRYPRHNQSKS